ncbi:MAG: polysaccharide pyruvyl transferase family protein [Thermofilaceae archaeon]
MQQIKIHIFGLMEKGNIGTMAAQKALIKFLKKYIDFDVSISVSNKNVFIYYFPEIKENEVYSPPELRISRKVVLSHFEWIIFTFLELLILNFSAIFWSLYERIPSRKYVLNRLRKCDVFIDLNLEKFRGIPISVSPVLIKYNSWIIIFHKIYWSLRILFTLWYLFLIKGIFKKKLIIGPASFGPFNGLPSLIRTMINFIFTRFVDLILVREPLSAKFLNEINVRNYIVVSDIALIDLKQHAKLSNSFNSGLTVGFAPAYIRYTLTKMEYENYIEAHVKLIDYLVDKYRCNILLMPSSTDDLVATNDIVSRIRNRDKVKIINTNNVDLYESIIRELDILVTSRMHPAIIAARNFIPFCNIIYDHKQVGFLRQIRLLDYSILINNVTYWKLKSLLDRTLQNRQKIKETIEKNIFKISKSLETALKISIKNLAFDN